MCLFRCFAGVVGVLRRTQNWDELDEKITRGLIVHFVDNYSEVFEIAFGKEKRTASQHPGQADAPSSADTEAEEEPQESGT